MFKEFENFFGSPVFIKADDVVGLRPDHDSYGRDRDSVTIVLLRGGHQMQVHGNIHEVLEKIQSDRD